MNIFSILTPLLLLIPAGLPEVQDTLGLSDAIEAALEHNHQIRISRIEHEKAVNIATRGYAGQLPTISINSDLNGSYSDLGLTPGSFIRNLAGPGEGAFPDATSYDGVLGAGFHAGLGTQLVIYDGMKGRLQYRLLKTGSELAGIRHHSDLEQTVLEVTRRYLYAVTLQKAIVLMELAMEQSNDRYSIIETRREYGQVSEQQLLQALADLKSDSTEYRDLRLRYDQAGRELHTAIGWKHDQMVRLDEEIQEMEFPTYDELFDSLLEHNTEIHLRQRRIEQAEIGQRLGRTRFLPTVTAALQYGYSYQFAEEGLFETQEQLGMTGGISVKIPLFTGGRNRTSLQNATATLRQEQILLDQSEQQIRMRFDNAWHERLHLENRLRTERDNLAVYERNFERAKDAFEQGMITGVELRSAQLSLHDSRLRISETEYQIKLAEITLLHLSGRLFSAAL